MDTQHLIRRIMDTFGDSYAAMNWIAPKTAAQATLERERLISEIFRHSQAQWRFSQTKPIAHAISPGCELCGQGAWSCLFINGVCNARCFYCPSAQNDTGPPMTASVAFSDPETYAAYVAAFDIKGVSFSGGEPFLNFDRVLSFLTTLRARVTRPLYIWMYTNGLLATQEKFQKLRDLGLDEVRFDLPADRYRLAGLESALGIIPRVTVEMPAIPEDLETTKGLLKTLGEMGVDFVNLHQIRCTPFNQPKLSQRGYTFVHGAGATVLETELAALELIRHALEEKWSLPINYCAFTFRHQYQKAGSRKRSARMICASHEGITPLGYIRSASLWGSGERLARCREQLVAAKADPGLWQAAGKGDHLLVDAPLLDLLDPADLKLKLQYSATSLRPSVSLRHRFKEVDLGRGKKVAVERYLAEPGIWLDPGQIQSFAAWLKEGQTTPLPGDLEPGIAGFESFEPGLAPYF